MQTLGSSVDAFMKDLEFLNIQDRVMGATVSEFGRRIISNASLGTDHGAAAPMFVFGNSIKGGIYGSNPVIPENPGVEDNLEMKVDFRSVYGSILQDWFCVNGSVLQSTLGTNRETLPFINENACLSTSIFDRHQEAGQVFISNYPNPFSEYTTIEFRSTGSPLQVSILDQRGRILETLAKGLYTPEQHTVKWNAGAYASGIYYARYQDQRIQQSRAMIKT
ncbi:MAG: DUF1501 domain-containing protein [Saprospiraceae bacterium]|nr:DUF1501 domain-containing protein [Saprospiraceae bacterium]